jgi:non-ribosomal peptide synthetase component E (peptide arylation enzyme)
MRPIDYFDKGAEIDPERAAIVEGDKQYSFREVRDLTFKVAAALKAAGFKRQAPVAI